MKKMYQKRYEYYIITDKTPLDENGIIKPVKNYYGECKSCHSVIKIIFSRKEFKVYTELMFLSTFSGIGCICLNHYLLQNVILDALSLIFGVIFLIVAVNLFWYTFIPLKRIDKILKNEPCKVCSQHQLSAFSSDMGWF